jgi:hypothetical protein
LGRRAQLSPGRRSGTSWPPSLAHETEPLLAVLTAAATWRCLLGLTEFPWIPPNPVRRVDNAYVGLGWFNRSRLGWSVWFGLG